MDSSQLNIQDCVFFSIWCNTSGSVVYAKSIPGSLSIFSSTMINCTSVVSGGAVLYDCKENGNCIMEKVCGFSCWFSGNYVVGHERGQFAYILVSMTRNNTINFVSFSKCADQKKDGVCSLALRQGITSTKNTNSSFNYARYGSSFEWVLSNSSFICMCTFSHNQATQYTSLKINHGVDTGLTGHTIKCCNIVGNNGPDFGVILFQGAGILNIDQCIFKGNSQYLLSSYGGYGGSCTLVARNCLISHSDTISRRFNGGIVSLTNITYSVISTYQIIHYQSYECFAEIPLIISTIDRTSIYSKTKMIIIISMMIIV